MLNKTENTYIVIFLIVMLLAGGYYFHKFKPFPHQYLAAAKNMFLDYDNFMKDKILKDKFPSWSIGGNDSHPICISKFEKGMSFYSDRSYVNDLNDDFFADYFLVRLPRHNTAINKIQLSFEEDVVVIRILCGRNKNELYNEWELVNDEVAIIGNSCSHTDIIQKTFKKGTYFFDLGGPVATDPILFKAIKKLDYKFYRLEES